MSQKGVDVTIGSNQFAVTLIDNTKGQAISGESQTPSLTATVAPTFVGLSMNASFEQTLNIGSQSSGAGAGKVTFNPITITKPWDKTTPSLFQHLASGTAYQQMIIRFLNSFADPKAAQASPGDAPVLYQLVFRLVAVKALNVRTASVDELNQFGLPLLEDVTFEFGAVHLTYNDQTTPGTPSGTPAQSGWNRVTNRQDAPTS